MHAVACGPGDEPNQGSISLRPINNSLSWWWNLNLSAGTEQSLKVGSYDDARRWPFHATFEQHCEGGSPALRGELSVVAKPWR